MFMVDVKIYTTPTCPYCIKAKDYFTKKGVKYTEYNVAQDRKALQEMIKLSGGRSVPVITAGDEVMIGFNQARFDEILEEGK
ncbi:MAG: NrdH-redoxin [Planctomycetes bacterium RIFCSPHIGHO2_02_FULL_50_42]|nr:MAG: NrdH-redoxin [Planctomycetes bacterium GWA2_50_13]OHB90490.1 MAG: NrdH-redoxin [Planctomycetes bacterium RIFCSPHIGHO2_02_FULL_50_42]OHB95488.1 MAG: NrdH-redoxin [Planctomycetes bacterium RIFCSPLOWO2_02_FULL_50_16]OHC02663.1 MAG: NrdH-redoxin [Planctomycetes bacterium RIFCSPLOWO2_12_FULL_50_35]HCN19002.1 NrdH-redoxin [Planctomycetia bacterium]